MLEENYSDLGTADSVILMLGKSDVNVIVHNNKMYKMNKWEWEK